MRQFRATLGRWLKELLGRIVVALGIHHRLLKGKAIVVAFHSVTETPSDGALRCSVEDFEAYCRFFARHMKVETLTQLTERLRGSGALAGELSITFDDGYADNVELASPVLKRWSLPATFFITTGFVGSETQAFWDVDSNLRSRWMSWSQARELVADGHELGSHTVNHIDLAKEPLSHARAELLQSKEHLLAQTGTTPTHFAIPFGRAFPGIEAAVTMAHEIGFASVSLCRGGLAVPNQVPCMERWPIVPNEYLSPYGWLFDVLREARARHVLPAGRVS